MQSVNRRIEHSVIQYDNNNNNMLMIRPGFERIIPTYDIIKKKGSNGVI